MSRLLSVFLEIQRESLSTDLPIFIYLILHTLEGETMMELKKMSTLAEQTKVDFFTHHWGSPQMVISSGVFDCSTLDGYYALDGAEIVGVITYVLDGGTCEVISLDSIKENQGVGTFLLQKVEKVAQEQGCNAIQLVTTNDNLRALAFYQKRGFRMAAILHDAVKKARKIKPEIPFTGFHDLPVLDEIILKKEW